MGGALIGVVDSVTPTRDAAGQPIAVMDLSLQKNVEPLPVDSTFDVRLKSSIGLKYIQVTKGTRARPTRMVRPSRSASPDPRSTSTSSCRCSTRRRVSASASTIGFSDALAGRGAGINDAIGAFVPLRRRIWGRWRATSRRRRPTSAVLPRPRVVLVRARARRTDAGRPVRESRHDVHRAGERRRPLPPAVDLRHAADVQRRDRHEPPHTGVPEQHRRAVQGAAPRASRRCRRAPRSSPTRSRPAPATCPGRPAGPAAAEPRPAPGELRADAGGQRRSGPADADGLEPALAARLPDTGPVLLQLRDPVPAQHREHALGRRDHGHGAAVQPRRDLRHAGQRRRPLAASVYDAEPVRASIGPIHVNPYPEHRLARPDPPSAPPATSATRARRRDRQPAGEPRAEDRDDDEGDE